MSHGAEQTVSSSSNSGGYSVQVESRDDEDKTYRDQLLPSLQSVPSSASVVKLLPERAGSGKNGSAYPNGDEISSGFLPSLNDDVFSSSPPTERLNQPGSETNDHSYENPSQSQIECFIDAAYSKITDAMRNFPTAYGLVIAFTNKMCPSAEGELPNIHMSSEKICSAFNKLGYACCAFSECCKAECLAVFTSLSRKNIIFPESYKMLFTYFAGHGQKDFIGLQDGYISINSLKELFDIDDPVVSSIPKVLFLDCCRRNPTDRSERLVSSVENLLIINTTRLYRRAYLVNDKGMGVGTIEFLNLLEQKKRCSFHDLIAQFIYAVKENYRQYSRALADQPDLNFPGDDYTSLWPDYEGSLDQYPNLYEDKLMGMRPVELVLQESGSSLKLTFQYPLHAQGFQHFFISTKSQRDQDWVKEFPELTSQELQLSIQQCAGKKFRVGATYKDEMDVLGQDTVYYELGDIKPTRVQVKRIGGDQAEIFWVESENLFLFDRNTCSVSIAKRKLHVNTEWSTIETVQVTCQCSYVIPSQEAEEYDYAVQYHVNGRSSNWVRAERMYCDKQQYRYFQDVTASQCNEGEVTLRWKESPHFSALMENETYIAVKMRAQNSDEWIDSQTDLRVSDRLCTISTGVSENSEFMVELIGTGNCGPYLIESKIISCKEPEHELSEANNNRRHTTRAKYIPPCCILLFIILMLMITVLVPVKYSYGFNKLSNTYLGVASDVIDCESMNSLQHLLYSSLSVTQKSDANKKDNPHLQIDVISIPYSNISYHSLHVHDVGTIVIQHASQSGPSIVPDDYYNRPWYLRNQSNITLEVNFIFHDPPSKMALYLFSNEGDVDSFMGDPNSTPRYENVINLLTSKQNAHVFTITKSSYYYMVADIRTTSRVDFFADVTFNIEYIDSDDYPSAYKRHIGSSGSTVHTPINSHEDELTVCSISPLPGNSLDSHTTHIQITYSARTSAATVLAVIIILANLAWTLLLFCIWKLTKKSCCISQNVQDDDAVQPLINYELS